MSDNKKIKNSHDSTRINTAERYEADYWTQKWKISPQQLRGAEKATNSSSVKKVEEYLRKKNRL